MKLELSSIFTDSIMAELERLDLVNEENKWHQLYTLAHKEAFLSLQVELLGVTDTKGILHDTDKLVFYGILSIADTNRLHRKYSTHHWTNIQDEADKTLCVIDYECARLTKPDKPLNAYNTIHKLHPESLELLTPTLQKLGLNQEIDVDFDFSNWNRVKDKVIADAIKKNIEGINELKSIMSKDGMDAAMKKFYNLD